MTDLDDGPDDPLPPTHETIEPPWSRDQVDALNTYQMAGRMHPFTCGGEHPPGESPILVATTHGWVCPERRCGYTQAWAHAFMTDPDWGEPFEWPS